MLRRCAKKKKRGKVVAYNNTDTMRYVEIRASRARVFVFVRLSLFRYRTPFSSTIYSFAYNNVVAIVYNKRIRCN